MFINMASTIYDIQVNGNATRGWLSAFSLRKNCQWLFSTSRAVDDIHVVHGIRFLNAIMLMFSHKSMAVFFNPYVNRTQLSESLGRSWTVIGRAASLYTDPFLMFSAMLTSYSVINRFHQSHLLNLKKEYVGRILRILPPLAALIIFYANILPHLGSGPQWNLVVEQHAHLCQRFWWRNILFVQNFFGFDNMCLTHTHHIAIDMQLFTMAPMITMAIWTRSSLSITILSALIVATTVLRFYTTMTYRLSNYVYFGVTTRKLLKTADYMYSLPLHRSTVYIMGIILGYSLKAYKDIKLTKSQLWMGSIGCMFCLVGTLLGPSFMSTMEYIYHPTHASWYAALAPVTWCLGSIWIVFTSHLGYSSRISHLLSWPGFQVFTKISYALYLTQFPVFFYNVGRRRYAEYYSFFETTFNINECLTILLTSILLTLFFDIPFQNIKSIMFK